MEIKDMNIEQVEARMAEINEEIEKEDADIEALNSETDALIEQRNLLVNKANEKRELLEKVANANIKPIEEGKKEERNEMDEKKEMRSQMIDALAEFIKGRATAEQRALLTTNATGGTVKVSDIVDDYVWTDWDKSNILSRIRKVYVKGNYSVGYEASATGATKHIEGNDETLPAEETLTLAYIEFVAQYFKKWITVSDSVMALKGEAFMRYLMDEFGHQLAMALESAIITELTTSTLTAQVTVTAIDNASAMAGFAQLSDEAVNPVVIVSRATYASIMNERTTAGAKIDDPFNGMEVLINNGVTGMLVGDLDGVVANFPEGEDFKFIIDDKSLAEKDLVKIVGKILADIHLVRPNGFAYVTTA